MPTPTAGDLYVSRPLTNISIAYFQDDQDFIADKVFPSIPVDHQYGMYYTYNKGDWLRTNTQRRAPRTESAGTGWRVGRENYRAEINAVHVDIADQDRANQERPVFDLDRDATKFVARDILLRRELDWVAAYFGPGIWSNTDQQGVSGVPGADEFKQWDLTSSTPIEDIEAERLKMWRMTGKKPNKLIIGPDVYSVFKNHPQYIERVKYSQKAILSLDLIAAMLDIEQVLIPGAVQNSAEENEDPDVMDIDFIYGNAALLLYAASSPSLMEPSAGYTFEYTGYLGGASRGIRTKKFRMEALAADRVETESAYDFKKVSGDLGVYFKDAVSS